MIKNIAGMAVLLLLLFSSPGYCDQLDDAYHEKHDQLRVMLKVGREKMEAAMKTNARQSTLKRYSSEISDLITQKNDLKTKLLEKNGKLPAWWIEEPKK